jgi:hypothetical protein
VPLPTSYDLVDIHGEYVAHDGTAAIGTITFIPERLLRETVENVIVLPKAKTVVLDANGEFTTQLPATDDPDLLGTPFRYRVVETFSNPEYSREYYMDVPYQTVGTLEMADQAPLPNLEEGELYVLKSELDDEATALAVDSGSDLRTQLDTLYAAIGHNHSGTYSALGHNHDTDYYTEAEVNTLLSGKANTAHTHEPVDVTDLAEFVRDTVATALVEGTGMTITVDDVANTITLASSGGGGGGVDMATLADNLIAGTNIDITYDDIEETITISTTATVNSSDATLLDRSNHTGEQAISTVTGLQDALDAKVATLDLAELIQDEMGSRLIEGDGIDINYDDVTGQVVIAALDDGTVSIEDLPAGSTVSVYKVGGIWPNRPTTRTDIRVDWVGADPDPAIVVPPALGGMYDNSNGYGDTRSVTE